MMTATAQRNRKNENGQRTDNTELRMILETEIAATETFLHQKEEELTRAAADFSVPLGDVLKLKSRRTELAAYLQGLRFLHDALSLTC